MTIEIREIKIDKLTDEEVQSLLNKYRLPPPKRNGTPGRRKIFPNGCEYLQSMYTSIKCRCYNPNNRSFHNYGGRGITCEFNSCFEFVDYILSNIGHRPSNKHQIDRVNNDGNYAPGNLRWATNAENNSNRRDNLMCEYNGQSMRFRDLHRLLDSKVNYNCARSRYYNMNYDPVKACLLPYQANCKGYRLANE